MQDVENLYALVEPKKNRNGFRVTNVVVAGKVIPWENIRRQMEQLLAVQNDLTPVEFYKEFEEIHAGADGNGRVGSLLFNYLSNTMTYPAAPPDVFANSAR
jgi:Fic family protein